MAHVTNPYAWGHEHFCAPDTRTLYDTEPERLTSIGYPVELEEPPTPPSFCSKCLLWFDDPAHDTEGSDHRPLQKGLTNEQDT